ncbi:MAG: saccharopine dehydrogenase C-terminal domain-containing protein [Gemmatimonadales bacterium]
MKILVLGRGFQGSACTFDLVRYTDATVTIADVSPGDLPNFLDPHASRIKMLELDVRDGDAVRAVMKEHEATLSAIPYYFNFEMAALAVEAGVHFADLGGNTGIVRQQQTLDEKAQRQGVTVVADCGLAPGMVNILAAEGMRRLDQVESVRLYVGGLPENPEPPLNYQIAYSLEGVLDYYTTAASVLRDGKPAEVAALSELENVRFEELGTLEAFHTAGGLSTMPWDFEGMVDTMEYKTLRYPGHAEAMRVIRDVGLLGLEPVMVKGTEVVPREAFIATVEPVLRKPGSPDLVALKAVIRGKKAGGPDEIVFELIDRYDQENGISAMMRTTGYSLAITGMMLVDGRIDKRGVYTAAQCTPYEEYARELGLRGVRIEEK